MKKIVLAFAVFISLFCINRANGQTGSGKTLTISFISNDFATAQLIRSTSLSSVLRNKQTAKLKDMAHGFAITYAKPATAHTTVAITAGGTFGRVPLANRSSSSDEFLLEVDASGHFKMLNDSATINPYLIAGVGASKYTNVYGAFIPLGGGVKFNIANEALVQVQLQYRVPVTTEANAHHFQISIGIGGVL